MSVRSKSLNQMPPTCRSGDFESKTYQRANAQCIDNVHYSLALLFYLQALITKLMEQLKVSKIIVDFLICFVLKQGNKNSGFITIACVCESASTITNTPGNTFFLVLLIRPSYL